MSAEVLVPEWLPLAEEQARDDRYGYRIPDRPLEFPAGLNPHGWKLGKPRRFRSGRRIIRRIRTADVRCGIEAMYRRGCRCGACRSAHSERRKRQRANGIG